MLSWEMQEWVDPDCCVKVRGQLSDVDLDLFTFSESVPLAVVKASKLTDHELLEIFLLFCPYHSWSVLTFQVFGTGYPLYQALGDTERASPQQWTHRIALQYSNTHNMQSGYTIKLTI